MDILLRKFFGFVVILLVSIAVAFLSLGAGIGALFAFWKLVGL